MKILVAIDGSRCARHALEEALRLLPVRDATVALVSVTPPLGLEPMVGLAPYPAVSIPPLPDAEETREHLAESRERLERLGVHPLLLEKTGDPASQIVAAAQEFDPDILVLGSHGRGALGRLVLGSVSDAVAHHWPGATLIVPLPPEAA